MKTKGINTEEQIQACKSCLELRMKSMMISCFSYGSIDKGSYYYNQYIEPYWKELGTKVFEEVYNEQKEFLKNCTVDVNVYTDSEGCTYNSINYPK